MMPNIAVMRTFVAIHNIPSPYRIHLFTAMNRELERRGIRFHVHFMSFRHKERPTSWQMPDISFPHTYWADRGSCINGMGFHFNPGLLAHLRRGPTPDFLLVGSAWCSLTGILASMGLPRGTGIVWIEANTKNPGRISGLAAAF